MNAMSPPPDRGTPLPRKVPRARRVDQAFLPAALEILETPPSPVGVALLWIICVLAVVVLAWSWLGRVDVVAVAQGKIQPAGQVKVIQPLEAGRVTAVHVENGQRVEQGEELVGLESGEADADVNALQADLDGYRAEVERRQAALAVVKMREMTSVPDIAWEDDIPAPIRTREAAVLEGDLGQLAASVAEFQAQLRQKELERDQYQATGDALSALVQTLRQRVDMRASLEHSGSGSKADVIDAVEKLQDQQAALATARGEAAVTAASVEVLRQNIENAYRTFAAQDLEKLADAERQVDDLAQKLAKARVKQRQMVLKSPIAGTVSALSVTTVGQVVSAGEQIMRIVPDRMGMEIECYIPNRDIGFVRLGQEAVVKVESLPFTRYGTIEAKVARIASDAIPEPDADQTEGNAIRSTRDRGFAGAERTQNLVFPATLHLEVRSVVADGIAVPLSPGMAVKVEIKTGSRRILEYVFAPLVQIASESMKER